MKNPFTEHPRSAGQTYFQHMLFAMSFAWGCFWAALGAFIHALLPFCCESAASRRIRQLHAQLEGHSNER